MKRYSLGIDIGGTKMRAVLLEGKKIVRALELKTPNTKQKFINNLKRSEGLAFNRKIPVGIGVAGIIKNTTVVLSPNIPYLKNFDFKKKLPLSAKIRVDNDARCFARGEANFGAGKKFKKAFAVTIGTGVGRACVQDGAVKNIKKFEYPETWENEYQKIRAKHDDAALAIFLGRKLFALIKSYQPDALILGGGALAKKRFFVLLKQELKRLSFSKSILRAHFKKNAGAIGAALAWQS